MMLYIQVNIFFIHVEMFTWVEPWQYKEEDKVSEERT